MKVPFLNLSQSFSVIQDEVLQRMTTVLFKANYIHGKEVTEFEQHFASYIGMKHCIGVANGTDALELAVQSLDYPNDSEIIVQGNTYIASCLGVVNNRHKLVVCDCDPTTHMIDVNDLKAKITSKTRVLILVHLFGSMPNMDEILALCKEHNILLIEDCAQAHGAMWNGQRAGSFGTLSCFSFYPGKNLGAYGDGGAICVNDDQLEQRLRRLSNLGCIQKYQHECIGRNSRLDTLQAVVLDTKLQYLDKNNERRRELANLYTTHLSRYVETPVIHPNCIPVYHLYVVKVPFNQRDALKAYLAEHEIDCGIHYPISITETKAFALLELGHPEQCIENSKHILSLPMYPEMTTEEIFHVISTIKNFFQTNYTMKSFPVDGKPGLLHAVNNLQFNTRRIFYIDSYQSQDIGKRRGFHANMNLNECMIIQEGLVQIELTNCMNESRIYTLEKGDVFYIPKQYWIEYTIVEANTVILVLADQTLANTKTVYTKHDFLQVSLPSV